MSIKKIDIFKPIDTKAYLDAAIKVAEYTWAQQEAPARC